MSQSYDRISIFGLYKFDNTIFDNFQLPEALASSKDDIVNNIFLECYELEVLYTDPEIMKLNIGLWSRKNLPGWTRMLRALTEEYDPLHNFDRHEEYTDAGSKQENRSESRSDSSSNTNSRTSSMNGSDSSVSSGASTANGEEQHKVMGFNQTEGWADQAKDISTNNGTSGTSTSGTSFSTTGESATGNTTGSSTGTSSSNGATTSAHSGHLYGNIGVTKSQEMLMDELKVRENNIIDIITKSFRDAFCLLVY